MAWNNKDFDPQGLSAAIVAAAQSLLSKISNISQSQEPRVEASDIVEYENRMRVDGIEKLKSTCFVSVVYFYLSAAEMERRAKPKGTLVLYLETESASKFFKALGIAFAEDEDDVSMLSACGQFTQKISDGLKEELSGRGYVPLYVAKPLNYKNGVTAGVEYSPDQKMKHDIGFYYFKHQVIAVDVTLAPIPKK